MKKKRVLVDGRFSSHHFAFRNVILNIADQLSKDEEYETFILLSKKSDIDDFKKLNTKLILISLDVDSSVRNHLFTLFCMPWIILRHRIDVTIYQTPCLFLFNPYSKVIIYLHDLIEYHIDNQIGSKLTFRKKTYPYLCKHSDRIITVSECSKKDIVNILEVDSEKVYVALDGKDEQLTPVDKQEARSYVKEKYGIDNYLFYIGYLTHPQKNLLYLIDEFSRFNKEHPETILAFAGPKGKDADLILSHAREMLPQDAFIYLGKVPYKDLKFLYSGCQMFCFPSLYEGFGMPVLEAMSCGAVVLASNRSSIPEILPDKRYLIDPEQISELTNKMEELYAKDNTAISNYNIERSRLFTWDEHGNVLRKVVKQLLGI